MSSEIRVDTGRLKRDADSVGNLIRTMERQITDIQSEISQMNSMWIGPAKTAFQKAVSDDIRSAREVLAELKSLQSFESQAREKYDQCEQQVSALVDALKG